MHRLLGMLVIVSMEIGLIGVFFALNGGWMTIAANAELWESHILRGYSLSTIIIGICSLAYLKIIWKLINRY